MDHDDHLNHSVSDSVVDETKTEHLTNEIVVSNNLSQVLNAPSRPTDGGTASTDIIIPVSSNENVRNARRWFASTFSRPRDDGQSSSSSPPLQLEQQHQDLDSSFPLSRPPTQISSSVWSSPLRIAETTTIEHIDVSNQTAASTKKPSLPQHHQSISHNDSLLVDKRMAQDNTAMDNNPMFSASHALTIALDSKDDKIHTNHHESDHAKERHSSVLPTHLVAPVESDDDDDGDTEMKDRTSSGMLKSPNISSKRQGANAKVLPVATKMDTAYSAVKKVDPPSMDIAPCPPALTRNTYLRTVRPGAVSVRGRDASDDSDNENATNDDFSETNHEQDRNNSYRASRMPSGSDALIRAELVDESERERQLQQLMEHNQALQEQLQAIHSNQTRLSVPQHHTYATVIGSISQEGPMTSSPGADDYTPDPEPDPWGNHIRLSSRFSLWLIISGVIIVAAAAITGGLLASSNQRNDTTTSLRPSTQPTSQYSPSISPTTTSPSSPVGRTYLPSDSHSWNPTARGNNTSDSKSPSLSPSSLPTLLNTIVPSNSPSMGPTQSYSISPSTNSPLDHSVPTQYPSFSIFFPPMILPTHSPTLSPTTSNPSFLSTSLPPLPQSAQPSTAIPSSFVPSPVPSNRLTYRPTRNLSTQRPTNSPQNQRPSFSPTAISTQRVTNIPSTSHPQHRPTRSPGIPLKPQDTKKPSTQPYHLPSFQPTRPITANPTDLKPQPSSPINSPSLAPGISPMNYPTPRPSNQPTRQPIAVSVPTHGPSDRPAPKPIANSAAPLVQPIPALTKAPTIFPSLRPTTPAVTFSPSTLNPTEAPQTPPPTTLTPTQLPTTISPTPLPSCFTGFQDLRQAVSVYLVDSSPRSSVARKYGWPIGAWCVSQVKEFSDLFAFTNFNEDINNWNMSSATTLSGMFQSNSAFNQNLNSWDVSNVLYMDEVFNNAVSFNGAISRWNTSRVATMKGLFSGASSFDAEIGNWDVRRVGDFTSTFLQATSFNKDLRLWNPRSAVSTINMFSGASRFRHNLCSWGKTLGRGSLGIVVATSMFRTTNCSVTDPPNLGARPPGPFCFACSSTPPTPSPASGAIPADALLAFNATFAPSANTNISNSFNI